MGDGSGPENRRAALSRLERSTRSPSVAALASSGVAVCDVCGLDCKVDCRLLRPSLWQRLLGLVVQRLG